MQEKLNSQPPIQNTLQCVMTLEIIEMSLESKTISSGNVRRKIVYVESQGRIETKPFDGMNENLVPWFTAFG